MKRARPTRSPLPRAFTLIELMVTIAIIAMLVGLLIPALGAAMKAAKKMTTTAQLDSIGKANEAYKIAFLNYAGPIGENYWQDDPVSPSGPLNFDNLTANENLVLGLLGRVRAEVTGFSDPNYDYSPIPGTDDYPYGGVDPGETLYVDNDNIGSGPYSILADKTYGAFYSPKKHELAEAGGTSGGSTGAPALGPNGIPEFVDRSYGQPILYFNARQGWSRAAGEYYGEDVGGIGAVSLSSNYGYIRTTQLHSRAQNSVWAAGAPLGQVWSQATSLLNPDTPPAGAGALTSANAVNNLAWLTINRKVSNTTPSPNDGNDIPRGGFVLTATGFDRIYFDAKQVDAVAGVFLNDSHLDRFDDVIVSGGVAP